MSDLDGNVRLDDVLALIGEMARLHLEKHGRIPEMIVAVGGTALAAHGIRPASFDVDLYVPEVDDDIVDILGERGRKQFGSQFRFDVTPVNTIWGYMAIRDIEASPAFRQLQVGTRSVTVRALSLETSYVLKAAAGRTKDLDDLPVIAPHVSLAAVLQRANETLGWFGDRTRLPEYVETLSRVLARDFGQGVDEIDAALSLPDVVRTKVADIRRVKDARLAALLTPIIRRVAGPIRPHHDRADRLIFDIEASGASDQVKAIAASRPDIATAVAARVLQETAPDEFAKWLKISTNARKEESQ